MVDSKVKTYIYKAIMKYIRTAGTCHRDLAARPLQEHTLPLQFMSQESRSARGCASQVQPAAGARELRQEAASATGARGRRPCSTAQEGADREDTRTGGEEQVWIDPFDCIELGSRAKREVWVLSKRKIKRKLRNRESEPKFFILKEFAYLVLNCVKF